MLAFSGETFTAEIVPLPDPELGLRVSQQGPPLWLPILGAVVAFISTSVYPLLSSYHKAHKAVDEADISHELELIRKKQVEKKLLTSDQDSLAQTLITDGEAVAYSDEAHSVENILAVLRG